MKLVKITEDEYDVVIDLGYARDDNISGKIIYKNPICYIHIDIVENFKKAILLAKSMGYRFKIFDIYRPVKAQEILWGACPDDRYVGNPYSNFKSPHNKGLAIDLTLINEHNQEIDMGAKIDEMSEISHLGRTDLPVEAQKNRAILLGIMTICGFDKLQSEWWHFHLPNHAEYPVIDHDKYELGMM